MAANPSSSQSFTQPDGLTTSHARPNGIKLTDEQVRRFICDGVVLLQSSLPPEVHEDIYDKLHWNSQHEFNMGNNVLPRVAELQQVLDDPVVHGGVQSVLGDDYIFHPHRFMHVAEPLAETERSISLVGDEHGPPMGEGSSANSAWHQDGQIPKGRTRWHMPRIAMILYFPQDTPMERGPTRVIPGTHMQPFVQPDDHAFAFVGDHIKAGTCFLIHFDIAHAALSNRTDATRYMLKFIYLRRSHPVVPSWDGGEVAWRPPETRLGRRGAVAAAALVGVASIPAYVGGSGTAALLLGAVVMGSSGGGVWGMAPSYLMERFPTEVRGVGPGLSYHVGAALGALTPLVLGRLQDGGMTTGSAMMACIAVSGLLVAAVVWLGPETRGRRFTATEA